MGEINQKKRKKFYRGQVYYIDLGDGVGSEVQKSRPCVVIQNNIGNKFSPTTIVCPISHRKKNTKQPTQVILNEKTISGNIDGVIMAEQIRVVDKKRIRECLGTLTKEGVKELDEAIRISIEV